MYYNEPVLIPEIQGRIFLRSKGDSVYVQFQISRTYDPETKNNRSERCIIGIQLPKKPEYMLPNDNYYKYFVTKEAAERNEQQETRDFVRKMAEWEEARDRFDHLYYDFQRVSKGRWNEVLCPDTVEAINQILEPVIEMLKEESDKTEETGGTDGTEETGKERARAGMRLELIPKPAEKAVGNVKIYEGKNYEYVNYLLGQFKGAIGRFFQKIKR